MKKFLIVFAVSAFVFACNSSDDQKPADEKNADTVAVTPAITNERGLELIGASDCTTCHGIDKKVIGPAYTDVAQKYENTPAVIDTLVNKVINGGSGNWGNIAMAPHPTIPEADAREMVKYIMSLKK
ncbi:MAG: c-type cytochrome [Chitinophagaceae bacterium]|nr:c-type cytochrome [Chitinophagaceae bacterium]